jgi:RNA polymerase sigma-70 factor (ECF subfamily)
MTVASLNNPLALPDDASLAARFAAGDDAAFDTAVALYAPRLTRLARRLLASSNPADADDAVQDAFIRAYLARKSFRADSHLLTWLTRITINACRAHRRRQALGLCLLQRLLNHRPTTAPDPGPQPDPLADTLRAAIRKLKTADRELIVLYYLEELPAPDIATLLALTPAALHTRLHRARKALARLLENAGVRP